MERIGSETVYEGQIVDVRIDEFRYDDGETADREIVVHPGAVAIVATELEPIPDHEPDPEERIEVIAWPVAELDRAIGECADSKTLIGLLLFTSSR